MQWVKNPLSSWNLILISLVNILAPAISIPLSLSSISRQDCDLLENYQFHLYFLIFVAIALFPTDLYAYFSNNKLQGIISLQSYEISEPQQPLHIWQVLSRCSVVLFTLACSGSQIFEIQSDLLLVWVSLYSSISYSFGFFAVVFPLLNQLARLLASVQMMTYAFKIQRKTISSEKIDKMLMTLCHFNVSRLIYPSGVSHNPKLMLAFIAKECLLKLIQITLKLVLVTPSLSNSCSGNASLLSVMLIGNLLSMMQMVFYMT